MIALLRTRLRLRTSDDGIAMIMVISVGAVLTLLIISAVALSVSSMKRSTADSGWNAALAAAYAGIEEYQSRLADEPAYTKYGNPDSTFSNPNKYPVGNSNLKVQLPPATKENPAFGLGKTGTWADVPVADGAGVVKSGAKYRYEVDNQVYADTGTVRLRSTGLVNGQTRTIVADLRQKGFIDYIYFTDYEMSDPVLPNSDADCVKKYLYDGRLDKCTIQFAATDVIGGPVHSNDTIVICGTTRFKGIVTTGNKAGGYYKKGGDSCGNAVFDQGTPSYAQVQAMPTSNTGIKKETRVDLLNEDVPRPGCLYTGPTQITLLTGGEMNVKSPWTQFTTVKGEPATAGSTLYDSQCGTAAALQSAAGATVKVPNNNVVYVQNIPLTGINSATEAQTTGPAKAASGGTAATPIACLNRVGTKMLNAEKLSQNVVKFPADGELPLTAGTASNASYGCRNGDVFIKGDLTGGAMTVAAENYVYITGDIKYGNPDSDMLGLIGNNAVWVYNPFNKDKGLLDSYKDKNRQIDAAILSLEHTFTVQNYTIGPSTSSGPYGRGTLTVNGAIAQRFRGPVATAGGTGYSKNYVYDTRFRYAAPPKFLSPVTTYYGVNVWVEVSPAFNKDGTAR